MGQQVIGTRVDGTVIMAAARCRICGRKLTSAKSIAVGVGCTCRKAIGMDTTNRDRAHRRRRRGRARRMAQEMYESKQMTFQW